MASRDCLHLEARIQAVKLLPSRERPGFVHFFTLLGVMIISFAGPVAKLAEAPAMSIAFYRLGISGVILGIIRLIRGRQEVTPVGKREWVLACLTGGALGLHYMLWFQSLRMTTVASSTVLVTMHPLVVLVLARVLWQERTSGRELVGVIIALVGAVIIGGGDLRLSRTYLIGDLIAVLAMVMMAVYLLMGGRLRPGMDLLSYTFAVYSTGALLLLAISIALGIPLTAATPDDWYVFIALAFGPNLLGHGLLNWALAFVRPAVVSIAIVAEPVIGAVIAWMLLGEVPSVNQITGGLLVLTGITAYLLARG